MFDMHYDLLSIAYTAYLKNDYQYLEKISKYFHQNNVKGVTANLYFMSREEMAYELHPDYYQDDVSVLEMFKKSKSVLDKYLSNVDVLYSIEGADFIKDSDELISLYKAGLDVLILCWNTESKYASGNRSEKGLTRDGYDLLETAIDLGLGIDLSHANENTFYDMIRFVAKKKKEGNEVCCFASHSNVRSICGNSRNLTDNQLKAIGQIGGSVGVFANRNFIVPIPRIYSSTKNEQKEYYIRHIDYIMNIMGSDNIMLATDDMKFCSEADSEYVDSEIYDYENIALHLKKVLSQKYGKDISNKLLYSNAKNNIFDYLRKKRK